jgi:hypothetical protein
MFCVCSLQAVSLHELCRKYSVLISTHACYGVEFLSRIESYTMIVATTIVIVIVIAIFEVLASGGGTALQPVLDAIAAGELNARVELIITNKVYTHIHATLTVHTILLHCRNTLVVLC